MSENPILTSIGEQEWLQPIADQGSELVKNAYQSAGAAGQTAKNLMHGTWLGHPLHPAITDVPVGSWTVAAVLDTMDAFGGSQYQPGADAAVMMGLISSVPAALSGMTDWADTHGKPQKVGAMHGILNLSAAALYATSYAARKADKRGLGRCLSYLGFGLVIASAYLGGELSYTQKIGVNHAPDPEGELPTDYTRAASEADLTEGKPLKVTLEGTDFMLVRSNGKIYAMAENCAHLSGPLSEGKIEDGCVTCPWHGSRFRLEDGSVVDGPATSGQPVLDVKIESGEVLVKARQG